jgi:hypothetical protein
VCEHDDLPVRGDELEQAGEAIDAGWVHRLHRIVDDDETEWALGVVARGTNRLSAIACSSPDS